jgi:methylenetetrahydrofolate dehydrogenase (NADP+)/methenyltetrahydrofolate cyclohydrolase
MIVDGKAIAAKLYEELTARVAACKVAPHLTVFTCAPNHATRAYLDLKRRHAFALGVGFSVVEILPETEPELAASSVAAAVPRTNGIIVQLPFPPGFTTEPLIAAIPPSHDVDGFHTTSDNGGVLPPVVGAIAKIAEVHQVSFAGQRVVVLGAGRLVGQPAALWAKAMGAEVTIVTETTPDRAATIKAADIIISGVGKPGLVTPAMVKPRVKVFDAGTSEAGGQLVGDVDPAVANEAALFTPVPGGIGPLTVACLFDNLLTLSAASGNVSAAPK